MMWEVWEWKIKTLRHFSPSNTSKNLVLIRETNLRQFSCLQTIISYFKFLRFFLSKRSESFYLAQLNTSRNLRSTCIGSIPYYLQINWFSLVVYCNPPFWLKWFLRYFSINYLRGIYVMLFNNSSFKSRHQLRRS